MQTPNSSAMGCSHRGELRTGLRIILAFLKVKLQHFRGAWRDPGAPAASRPKGVNVNLLKKIVTLKKKNVRSRSSGVLVLVTFR